MIIIPNPHHVTNLIRSWLSWSFIVSLSMSSLDEWIGLVDDDNKDEASKIKWLVV